MLKLDGKVRRNRLGLGSVNGRARSCCLLLCTAPHPPRVGRGGHRMPSAGGHTALCQPVPPGTAKWAGTRQKKCPHEVPTVPCRTVPPQPRGPMGGEALTPHQGHAAAASTGKGPGGGGSPKPLQPVPSPRHRWDPPSCSRSALPPPGVHRPGRAAPRPALRGPAGPAGREAVAQVTSPGWDGDAGTRGEGAAGGSCLSSCPGCARFGACRGLRTPLS